MEDMARLALVEQNVKDINKFSNILHELLRYINHILDNPHDKELRTIKSDTLKKVLDCQAFGDYLRYIGFVSEQNSFTFPIEQTLSKLRVAQAALERKISFCCGHIKSNVSISCSGIIGSQTKRPPLSPANVLPENPQNGSQIHLNLAGKITERPSEVLKCLIRYVPSGISCTANIMTTQNSLLLKIQSLFNNMLTYEDEDLQKTAREHIPLVTLQLMALDRMREQQRKIKTGELKGQDMSFDIALMLELLGWFKHKFFTWVDQPECTNCGGTTTFLNNSSLKSKTETCRVEVYKCVECATVCKFPRYNDVRTLLDTRRGRCGEWANCFTLLCRALGYDTRYVYDITDHVWCEVFDYDSNSWLHADPCEGKLNAPLIYTHGWGKKLSYVIAVSRDDLQDVTWRYSSDHKEVLSRRTEVSEVELVAALLSLREHRHAQLSAARRKYLTVRNLRELADLMVERQPTDYESHGRISGSKEWRTERGEIGSDKSHTFEFTGPGNISVQYYIGPDEYRISCDDAQTETVETWANGVFEMRKVFRKVEKEWHKVYLAREEGESTGSISWRLSAKGERLSFNALSIKAITALYETGRVDWTIQFDDEEPTPVQLNSTTLSFSRWFTSVRLSAHLSGGVGDVSWQHAQLFRQSLTDSGSTLAIQATIVSR